MGITTTDICCFGLVANVKVSISITYILLGSCINSSSLLFITNNCILSNQSLIESTVFIMSSTLLSEGKTILSALFVPIILNLSNHVYPVMKCDKYENKILINLRMNNTVKLHKFILTWYPILKWNSHFLFSHTELNI